MSYTRKNSLIAISQCKILWWKTNNICTFLDRSHPKTFLQVRTIVTFLINCLHTFVFLISQKNKFAELSMCLPKILFREFMFALVFSMPLIFTLLANSICHFLTASMNFSCFNFFQQNSSPLFLITRPCSFSVIHMSRGSHRIFWKKIKDFARTPFLQ